MDPTILFLKQLRQLQEAKGTFRKMKVLSDIWGQVSALPEEQRQQIFVELGIQGGQSVLNQFLSSPGTRASEFISWSESLLREVDVDRLESRIRARRGFDQKADLPQALRRIRNAVTRSGEDVLSPVPPVQPGLEEERAEPETTKVPIPPEAPLSSSGESLSKNADQRSPEAVDRPKTVPLPSVPPLLSEPAAIAIHSPEEPESAEQQRSQLQEEGSRAESDRREAAPPLSPAGQRSSDRSLPEIIAGLESLNSSVARFREALAEIRAGAWPSADLLRLLDLFSADWMRRRLLSEYLRNPGPEESIEDLVELIKTSVPRDHDLIWFVPQLIHLQKVKKSFRAKSLFRDSTPKPVKQRILRSFELQGEE